MPEEEKKTVDIDTSGPDVDINLPEEKDPKEVEVKDENNTKSDDTSEKSDVKSDIQETSDEKQETKTEEKQEELEQYSEGVQKRISKLTKKWREARDPQRVAEAIEIAGGRPLISKLGASGVHLL